MDRDVTFFLVSDGALTMDTVEEASESDQEVARGAVEDVFARVDEDGSPKRCPKCGRRTPVHAYAREKTLMTTRERRTASTAQHHNHLSRDRGHLSPAPSTASDHPQAEVHANHAGHHLATRTNRGDQPGYPHWHENYGLSSFAQPWLARSHRTTVTPEIQFAQSQELAAP